MTESLLDTEPTDRPQQSVRRPIGRSVLDLAVVADGSTTASALTETTELAKRADELGFDRIRERVHRWA